MVKRIAWPEGKRFAFTIFDDTDRQTLANGPPVYNFLIDQGFRTTKSVWPLCGRQVPRVGGSTCQEADYLAWVIGLQRQGFEIGLHNATFHTSQRGETRAGITRFKDLFGHYPQTMANHTGCQESIYWGAARVSGANRFAYNVLTRYRNMDLGQGHIPASPLFWGDLCQQNIKYVRNFVYNDINTLKACPIMPYRDPERPYVNYWFSSAEGPDVASFVRTVSEANQDRLEEEGGACIMYTHLASGFYRDGKLEPRFRSLMERLGRKNGWFVPVGVLLDHLLKANGGHVVTRRQRAALERKWLLSKIRIGRRT